MRRTIILLTGLLAALAIALRRALEKPLFTPESAYANLPVSIENATWYLAARLALLVGLLVLVGLAYHRWKLPEEGLLALIASPPLLAIPLTTGMALPIAAATAATAALWHTPLAGLAAAVLGTLHPASAPLGLLAAIALLITKRWKNAALAATGSIVGIILWGLPSAALRFGELGVLGAPSLFILLIAIVGVLTTWSKKTYPLLLLTLAATVISLVLPVLALAHALLASVLAGYALRALRERDWRLTSVRNITLLLAACGLLFAAVSTVNEAYNAAPDQSAITAATIVIASDAPVFALQPHASVLEWYGANTTQKNASLLLNTYRYAAVENALPPFIALHEDDRAPGLRFLIENTQRFTLVSRGELSVWTAQPQEALTMDGGSANRWIS